ncbi:MAG: efflux RND transporter periplasmic adaptor subunit, partial [Acidobacteriota bacterium]
DRGGGAELTVRRGDLRPRLLLTGEIAAARAEELKVPRTPSWQVQVRWLAEDGTPVKAGDRVVELDNTSFTGELEEKRATAADATTELARKQAETRSTLAEKEFAVEQKKGELAKARIAAEVPADLLSVREHQDRQLTLHRAEVELAKAQKDLSALREANAADHPWEGRKLREGDNIWVGMTVAILPELSTLEVHASLSDVDDGRIKPGMEAVCTLDAYPSVSFHGRVVDISAVAEEAPRRPLLRSFPVRIRLDRLDPEKMRPGMSVRVEIQGPEVRGGLLVPRAALDFSTERPRALLAAGGAREVRLGPCDASFCV